MGGLHIEWRSSIDMHMLINIRKINSTLSQILSACYGHVLRTNERRSITKLRIAATDMFPLFHGRYISLHMIIYMNVSTPKSNEPNSNTSYILFWIIVMLPL